jgi:hypothetical protein
MTELTKEEMEQVRLTQEKLAIERENRHKQSAIRDLLQDLLETSVTDAEVDLVLLQLKAKVELNSWDNLVLTPLPKRKPTHKKVLPLATSARIVGPGETTLILYLHIQAEFDYLPDFSPHHGS